MRKFISAGLIFLTIFSLACSTDSSKEKATAKEGKATEGKDFILNTKDAMMAKLAEYKITIPEGMVFRSVDKQVYLDKNFEEKDTYLIYFDIKYKDNAKKVELQKWFNDQRKILKENGWTEKSYKKDIEILGGGKYDKAIFVKESENCTLDVRLTFNEIGSSISIHPKYEIR